MKTEALDLAIVGAGLTGLAAARRAKELGLKAEIFEASEGVGGRIQSDRIDGFICDRGFQLINPAYPALARYYDGRSEEDDFHQLERAIDVVIGGKVLRLGDPRDSIRHFFGALSGETGSWREKLRFLGFLRDVSKSRSGPTAADRDFEVEMFERGVGTFFSRVIGPFASGVFLNMPSRISAEVARELIYFFLNGRPGLPRGGVGELSKSLAEGLDIHLKKSVDEIGDDYIRVGRKRVKTRAIIVATDPISSGALLGERFPSSISTAMSASTTWYHSVDHRDFPSLLRLDGGAGGPVTNTIAISKIAPEYAPSGKTLVSTTVMSAYGQEVSEARVRRHLSQLWKMETSGWNLVAKYAIPKSLPLVSPGQSRPVIHLVPRKRGEVPIVLAGDFLALPAQQGAMESGIRAAESVAAKN